MKTQANLIRPGWVIEHNGKQWSVLKINLLQPGKGSAFIQVEMRDVATGIKSNERWRTSETIEKLMVEERDVQFLYSDEDNYTFMEADTYEQFVVDKDAIGSSVIFIQDGMNLTGNYIDGTPVSVTPPTTVVMEITETEPVVKGQTAASSNKPAILENGHRIMVPPFVGAGDKVVVNTVEGTYLERAKK
ncbi:MAG: elongation factor P [Alphaproteobacteria bacterium]|nr:elongation factor P [Alphaproteobacteria bacterium]